MENLNIKRLVSLPGVLEASTMYITRNAGNANLVDLTFVGTSTSEVRHILGQADVQSAIDLAIEGLTAADIPDLPGSKITSTLSVDTTGNAATATLAADATKLETARSITLNGVVAGTTSFDGSQNVTITTTMEAVGTAGEQAPVVTTDEGGRVVSSRALLAADIPSLPGSKITSALSVDTTGNAATATTAESAALADAATKLATPRSINGVAFDGTQNIDISAEDTVTPRVSVAALGVTVATLVAGKIPVSQIPNGLDNIESFPDEASFPATGEADVIYVANDVNLMYRWTGSGYIQIPSGGGVTDSANKLTTPRAISLDGAVTGTVNFDGSQDVTITATLENVITAGEQAPVVTVDSKGRVLSSRALVEGDVPDLSGSKIVSALTVDTSGNAATATLAASATKLATPRSISVDGALTGTVSFDGTEDVTLTATLANVGTAGEQGPVVTTDAKGRVTDSRALVAADIPDLPGSKITSILSVDTTGNAATATLAETATLALTAEALSITAEW